MAEQKLENIRACKGDGSAAGESVRIAVAGIGYVGLSLAVLLSRKYEVCAVDLLPERVAALNRGESPIADADIEEALRSGELRLRATPDAEEAYARADFVIVAVPTNYDPERNAFDTSAVESVVRQALAVNPATTVVIKSTLPVGYTARLREALSRARILFSPEFLREGRALRDNLFPSRIIIGADLQDAPLLEKAKQFAEMLRGCALKPDVPVLLMNSGEAESVKLFANTYLAMRVGFFNELDTYASAKGLNVGDIIRGVCLDPRIGNQYNNPSFGYGGYCLPKDARQLRASFGAIPQRLMSAIVETNDVRKDYIVSEILRRVAGVPEPVAGVYRLTMKAKSDNFRQSTIRDIMARLRKRGVRIVIYEPTLGDAPGFDGCAVENDWERFTDMSDVIVANRYDRVLDPFRDKVYTRDLFRRD